MQMDQLHLNQVVERFYSAFAQRDAAGMCDCYAADVRFSDPVFPDLQGESAQNMWRMLCASSQDLRVEFKVLRAADDLVEVRWDAWYSFSKTGRRVHNRILAKIRVRDGKVVEHRDHFSFWRWSRQALGPIGWILGWSPWLRAKVRAQAAASLAHYSRTVRS